jgi:hypothetical protein
MSAWRDRLTWDQLRRVNPQTVGEELLAESERLNKRRKHKLTLSQVYERMIHGK